jgi:hypothetical protein
MIPLPFLPHNLLHSPVNLCPRRYMSDLITNSPVWHVTCDGLVRVGVGGGKVHLKREDSPLPGHFQDRQALENPAGQLANHSAQPQHASNLLTNFPLPAQQQQSHCWKPSQPWGSPVFRVTVQPFALPWAAATDRRASYTRGLARADCSHASMLLSPSRPATRGSVSCAHSPTPPRALSRLSRRLRMQEQIQSSVSLPCRPVVLSLSVLPTARCCPSRCPQICGPVCSTLRLS